MALQSMAGYQANEIKTMQGSRRPNWEGMPETLDGLKERRQPYHLGGIWPNEPPFAAIGTDILQVNSLERPYWPKSNPDILSGLFAHCDISAFPPAMFHLLNPPEYMQEKVVYH